MRGAWHYERVRGVWHYETLEQDVSRFRRPWPILRRGKGPAAARQALWQLQLSCERVDATRTDHAAHHSLVGDGVRHTPPRSKFAGAVVANETDIEKKPDTSMIRISTSQENPANDVT